MAAAAAAKARSPGALLLRNSRLMSLPPPLPSSSSNTNIWAPPGSSTTHPTSQVITTPSSSHFRGDWGLKRNLPQRVTQKYLKYHHLDTLEHRTTFESAHGEVMVLRRWQEMDIPLTRSGDMTKRDYQVRLSAFDEVDEIDDVTGRKDSDPTPEEEASIKPRGHNRKSTSMAAIPASFSRRSPNQWRFKGPFLQAMNPKELSSYLAEKVKPRKAEFVRYLKLHQYYKSHNVISSVPNRQPTEADLDAIDINLSSLRNDPLTLGPLIVSFLDLPTLFPPPATHPSAGLYYTRTPAHMPNHPYHGPQLAASSLPGRQLASRTNVLAGVGGLVAKVVELKFAYSEKEPAYIRENREVVRWYRPMWASVDPEGAVLLEVQSAQPPPMGTIGPGAATAAPIVQEMMEREMEQHRQLLEQERLNREFSQQYYMGQNTQYGGGDQQFQQGMYYEDPQQQQYGYQYQQQLQQPQYPDSQYPADAQYPTQTPQQQYPQNTNYYANQYQPQPQPTTTPWAGMIQPGSRQQRQPYASANSGNRNGNNYNNNNNGYADQSQSTSQSQQQPPPRPSAAQPARQSLNAANDVLSLLEDT